MYNAANSYINNFVGPPIICQSDDFKIEFCECRNDVDMSQKRFLVPVVTQFLMIMELAIVTTGITCGRGSGVIMKLYSVVNEYLS